MLRTTFSVVEQERPTWTGTPQSVCAAAGRVSERVPKGKGIEMSENNT